MRYMNRPRTEFHQTFAPFPDLCARRTPKTTVARRTPNKEEGRSAAGGGKGGTNGGDIASKGKRTIGKLEEEESTDWERKDGHVDRRG